MCDSYPRIRVHIIGYTIPRLCLILADIAVMKKYLQEELYWETLDLRIQRTAVMIFVVINVVKSAIMGPSSTRVGGRHSCIAVISLDK